MSLRCGPKNNLETARDVAQQVFVSLARKAERLLGHDRIAAWLYRAAQLVAYFLKRTRKKRQAMLTPTHRPTNEGDERSDWDTRRKAFNADTVEALGERLPASDLEEVQLLDAFEIIDPRRPAG